MAKKHMKRRSTLLAAMRCSFTPTRMAMIKKVRTGVTGVGEDERLWNPHTWLGGHF
jgi:hypothetical protein